MKRPKRKNESVFLDKNFIRWVIKYSIFKTVCFSDIQKKLGVSRIAVKKWAVNNNYIGICKCMHIYLDLYSRGHMGSIYKYVKNIPISKTNHADYLSNSLRRTLIKNDLSTILLDSRDMKIIERLKPYLDSLSIPLNY